ncbi:hypothetical protein GPALN_013263 [Globodera pallida]|nr:hypothetical protein GPALN_013263 [Globodera pallida]
MYALLLILVVLLRATNGSYATTVPVGAKQGMELVTCPKGLTHCMKMDCSMDEETLRKHPLPSIPSGIAL